MKLFALIAAVSADWNGVSEDNSCGMQLSGDSMVNSTCTITGSNIKTVFAGNGAFITGAGYAVTGFDGISGNVDAVVFFEQTCDADGNCDNSTCWDAAVNCVDNGAASAGVFFMESVNDNRGAVGNYNLQIAGASAGDVLSIDLNGWAATNITAPFGTVDGDGSVFSVTVGDGPFGDLFQVSVSSADENQGALNLWDSSVTN
jgi:hypothetical protein